MEKKFMRIKLLSLGVFLILSHVIKGQQNNSLYFTDRIPQSAQLNPALQPACKFYFGMPLVSGIEVNLGNNALGLSDIYKKDNGVDTWFLATKELTTQTLDKLRKNNIISSSFQLDILSFGFKIQESYLSFLISEKFNSNINIPKDLISLAYQGIDFGDSYSFSNFGANASHYREYSIGYSQKIGDRLFFGIRGKILFGKANINWKQTDITISVPELNSPDWESVNVSSSIRVNTSLPHQKIHADENGLPDSLESREFPNTSDILNDFVLLKKNKGIGLDLGFQYMINDKVTLSGSITDLGYINWKSDVNSVSGGGEYQFRGIDLQNDSTFAEDLLDSVKNAFDASVFYDPYNTMLTPKLYAGISYTPNRFIKVGLLARSEYILKTFRQQITGSLIMYPTQALSATVSYTIADRVYDNLGIGLIFRGGPLQFYLMSDRIPLFWYKAKNNDIPFLPAYAKSVNLRLGLNLVFGINTYRKLKKDQPFLD